MMKQKKEKYKKKFPTIEELEKQEKLLYYGVILTEK